MGVVLPENENNFLYREDESLEGLQGLVRIRRFSVFLFLWGTVPPPIEHS